VGTEAKSAGLSHPQLLPPLLAAAPAGVVLASAGEGGGVAENLPESVALDETLTALTMVAAMVIADRSERCPLRNGVAWVLLGCFQ
jgi:hypothetical protein